MLYGGGALALFELALLIYCALNVITTPEAQVRNLPKLLWLVLVVFLPVVGSVAWLVAGRPQGPSRSLPYQGNTGIPPEYDRPGRASAHRPDDDAAFLRGLRDRARSSASRRSSSAGKPNSSARTTPVSRSGIAQRSPRVDPARGSSEQEVVLHGVLRPGGPGSVLLRHG